MALTDEFIDAVSNNKMIRVRIMLKDIMLVDPSLNTFTEMLAYAEKNMTDLYDAHDGEEFLHSASEWTEDYMNQQMVSIVTNFSKERIGILKQIVMHLYGSKVNMEGEKSRKSTSSNTGSSAAVSNGGITGMQIAGGGIAVAGAGTLVGGIIGSNIPVAIVGGIAVAGGAALIVMGGNKEA